MDWSPADYLLFGLMVAALMTGLVLARRWSVHAAYGSGAMLALGAGFVMSWANGAVGLIGSEDDPRNLVFLTLPAVGLAGAALSRLRASGLARTCMAMLLVQLVIGAGFGIARLTGSGDLPARDILLTTLVFGVAWALAAVLFRRAARAQS